MIRRALMVLTLSCLPHVAAESQETRRPTGDPRAALTAAAQKAMAPFAWLLGEWEGTATVFMDNGGTMTLTQRETVTSASFQTAMLIQGRGTMKVGGVDRQTWDAAALFGYDAPSGKLSFASASGSGQMQMFSATAQGDGFTWGFTDAAKVEHRYVVTRTSDGKWREVGQTSADGGATWKTTIELLLTRQSGPGR